MSTPFVNFSGDNLPLTLIYTDVYSNVSGQVLEIDKFLVPPGHLWSRLFATRVLIGDDYTNRGYITQKLIDLGYIAKAIYSPIIPQGFLFVQSFESGAWFQVDAVEVDPSNSDPATQEDASFQSTAVASPPDGTVINFNVEIPAGSWFILGLDDTTCVGMTLDTVDNPGDISMLYAKRNIQQFPSLPIPISIPNTCSLVFDDQDNNQYVLQIDDNGQLFFTPYFGITPMSLVGQDRLGNDSLFWLTLEPVLNNSPYPHNTIVIDLSAPLPAQASYVGAYISGPHCPSGSGYSGTVSFAWDVPSIADCEAGTFSVYGSSKDGYWSTSGNLTVSSIAEEPTWGLM